MKDSHTVEIVSYDPKWPELFKQEAERIKTALGAQVKEIYHMGSTAIPNMPAKPVIDIMLVCDNLDEIDFIAEKLRGLNYFNLRRQIIPHQSFFVRRQDSDISFHLHLHERGSPQINRHINFRDYVIQHPKDAKAYAELKIHLAAEFANDISQYVLSKDSLVQEIDRKAKLWPQRKKDYVQANTGPAAKDWSQEKIVKAMVANFNVYMTHFAQYLSPVELIRIPGFTIVNSNLPDATFNYVLDADFSSAEAKEKILEVTNYFGEKNLPFSWWLSPLDKPDDLSENLMHDGYLNTKNNMAMYFDLDTWDESIAFPALLEIIRARDEKTLHDFARVLANDEITFEKYFSWLASVLTDEDPIEYYVGYIHGKPVVSGLSCYFAQVAGLYCLSDAPDEQRKEYDVAMQQYCLKRAKELGYHLATVQASSTEPSFYQGLGYQECGIFREFKLKPVS